MTSPLFAARQAAPLARVRAGRLLVNIVPGGDQAEMRADGVTLAHGARYAQIGEFLDVWHRLMAGERVDHQGEHIFAEGAELLFPPVQKTARRSTSGVPPMRPWPSRPSISTAS